MSPLTDTIVHYYNEVSLFRSLCSMASLISVTGCGDDHLRTPLEITMKTIHISLSNLPVSL